MTVTIVADHGTHLMITDQSRYAVIERRNGHFYSCHDGERQGVATLDDSSIEKILGHGDWTDRETAQAAFDEVIARGNELAQRML